jgi:GcrA cell cycle regulator
MAVWTDDRIEELKRRWGEGESFAVIATKLRVSRNAAIGKAHRLGLVEKRPSTLTLSSLRPKPRKLRRAPGTRGRVNWKSYSLPDLPEPELTEEQASACAVSLLELKKHHCRWPIGDNKYCGQHKCGHQQPYCSRHLKLGTTPAKPRGKAFYAPWGRT